MESVPSTNSPPDCSGIVQGNQGYPRVGFTSLTVPVSNHHNAIGGSSKVLANKIAACEVVRASYDLDLLDDLGARCVVCGPELTFAGFPVTKS